MKTTRSLLKLTMTATVGIAAGLLLSLPAKMAAAETGTAKGGATKLVELSTAKQVTPVPASVHKPMACASCKDTTAVTPDKDTKGGGAKALISGGPPARVVAKHLCGTCGNDWTVKGHGKAKVNVALHKCLSCR